MQVGRKEVEGQAKVEEELDPSFPTLPRSNISLTLLLLHVEISEQLLES